MIPPRTFTDASESADWARKGWFILASKDGCSPPLKGQRELIPRENVCETPVKDRYGWPYRLRAVKDGAKLHFELMDVKKDLLYRSPDLESITAISSPTPESLRQIESQQPTLIGFQRVKKLPEEIQQRFDRIWALLRKQ